jgi:hypothetical protein
VALTDRPVLIGCPPSSGSTLFSVMLDAHPDVFCGPELGLLAHPLVFRGPFGDYRRQALRYLRRKSFSVSRRLPPWLARHRAGLNPYLRLHHKKIDYYGLDPRSLRALLKRSRSLDDFLEGLFGPRLRESGKSVWAEKSPPNLYSFGAFLDRFPEGKVVYLVRDPRDAVCSLIRRKFSFKRAVGVWLVETALCLRHESHPRVLQVRYEDLVRETAETMERVLAFLGLPPHLDAVLGYRQSSARVRGDPRLTLRSWRLSPADGISDTSIGQWREFLSPVQRIALRTTRIHRPPGELDLPEGRSVADLMDQLGYLPDSLRPVRSIHLFSFLQEEQFLPNGKYPKRSRVFQERLIGCAVNRIPTWPARRPSFRSPLTLDPSAVPVPR